MKVAVLGCGPSGLVAAHAVQTLGHSVIVMSKKRKSQIYGAQYLHDSIPSVPVSAPMKVTYRIVGSPEEYLKKVYRDDWDGSISDELRGDQEHLAWDMRQTYNYLWMMYCDFIVDAEFSTPDFPGINEMLAKEVDLVINTLPRKLLCQRGHRFRSTDIWAAGDAPEEGIFIPQQCDNGDILYNGKESPSWYRLSNIFGCKTVEWPGWMDKPPVETVSRVSKPISHNCDCFADWRHVGRFGRWMKDKHVHQVFNDTREIVMLKEMDS